MRFLFGLALMALVSRGEVVYKVDLGNNQVAAVPAERYVAGVLAGESSVFRSEEALKAMAIAARTYAARLRGRHAAEGFDFCSTTHCQRYQPQGIRKRLTRAAQDTAGELLWFQGKLAFAAYSRSCGGMTEAGSVVWPDVPAPYLKVHADEYCNRNGLANWTWTVASADLVTALRASHLDVPDLLGGITVLTRTDSGRAKTLALSGHRTVQIAASSLRFAVGRSLGWNTLRSERYQVAGGGGRIHFDGQGEGHGVGLCQRGADQMGLAGRGYLEILAFYYPGTAVALRGAGLRWVRLGGEGITLLTTAPDQDRKVLGMAETLAAELQRQYHWPAQPGIEIFVYPDAETFRNATGEPGWIAARASGLKIELQPSGLLEHRGVLRATLRHELLHVTVERQAASGIPVWFREGLVEWLAEPDRRAARSTEVSDSDLQQRQDQARARQAYGNAKTRVTELINRYGETSVFGWLARGLPAEVKNSSANSAATNSR